MLEAAQPEVVAMHTPLSDPLVQPILFLLAILWPLVVTGALVVLIGRYFAQRRRSRQRELRFLRDCALEAAVRTRSRRLPERPDSSRPGAA